MMENDNAPGHAVALINQAIDVLLRAGGAPASPVNTFQRAKQRRELRRTAKRLREGKAEPRNKNLSAEELAGICERTARRDEIGEQAIMDFKRITFQLGRVLAENDPDVRAAIDAFILETERSAEQNGPGSEAAERYRQLLFLAWIGLRWNDGKRRQRGPGRPPWPSRTER